MNPHNLSFAYFGTPDLAATILERLKSAGYVPKVIVTNPDRPQGRKLVITPPPVKVWAQENNIPILQPEKLGKNFREQLAEYNADLNIVVAYGKILPGRVIRMPKHGTINIHYSLLPKYRGAAPVEYAIKNGDSKTGVSIQQMVMELDAGPIIAERTHPISPTIVAQELREELTEVGAELLIETLPKIVAGDIQPREQDGSQATFAGLIAKSDGEIDAINGDPIQNYNTYRAFHRWPRTYYFDTDSKRVIITGAELRDGKFVITKIIPEGGKEIEIKK